MELIQNVQIFILSRWIFIKPFPPEFLPPFFPPVSIRPVSRPPHLSFALYIVTFLSMGRRQPSIHGPTQKANPCKRHFKTFKTFHVWLFISFSHIHQLPRRWFYFIFLFPPYCDSISYWNPVICLTNRPCVKKKTATSSLFLIRCKLDFMWTFPFPRYSSNFENGKNLGILCRICTKFSRNYHLSTFSFSPPSVCAFETCPPTLTIMPSWNVIQYT